MNRFLILTLITITFFSCQQNNSSGTDSSISKADGIVDKAMNAHGSSNLLDQKVSFTFRKKQYSVERSADKYIYRHSFSDSLGKRDFELINSSQISAKYNDTPGTLSGKQAAALREGINSVLYFIQLPYGLKDGAVTLFLLPSSKKVEEKIFKTNICIGLMKKQE